MIPRTPAVQMAAPVAPRSAYLDRNRRAREALQPAPERWRDFPLSLVRLLEETYDIVSEGGTTTPPWSEVLFQMSVWMPGVGVEPWDRNEFPALKGMQYHIRNYRKAGFPEEGVPPHGTRVSTPVNIGECSAGHRMAGDNVYARPDGRTECRTCRRTKEVRWGNRP